MLRPNTQFPSVLVADSTSRWQSSLEVFFFFLQSQEDAEKEVREDRTTGQLYEWNGLERRTVFMLSRWSYDSLSNRIADEMHGHD